MTAESIYGRNEREQLESIDYFIGQFRNFSVLETSVACRGLGDEYFAFRNLSQGYTHFNEALYEALGIGLRNNSEVFDFITPDRIADAVNDVYTLIAPLIDNPEDELARRLLEKAFVFGLNGETVKKYKLAFIAIEGMKNVPKK